VGRILNSATLTTTREIPSITVWPLYNLQNVYILRKKVNFPYNTNKLFQEIYTVCLKNIFFQVFFEFTYNSGP
jgi:hypothetical protein